MIPLHEVHAPSPFSHIPRWTLAEYDLLQEDLCDGRLHEMWIENDGRPYGRWIKDDLEYVIYAREYRGDSDALEAANRRFGLTGQSWYIGRQHCVDHL